MTHKMSMPMPLLAALAGLALSGASDTPLAGTWSASDATLVLGASGGHLQQGCALLTLDPIHVDGSGRFTAQGRFETLSLQPPDESADAAVAQTARTRPASLSGELRGNAVALVLTVGSESPRQLTLLAGQKAHPARCL
jgi:hypothetical protein